MMSLPVQVAPPSVGIEHKAKGEQIEASHFYDAVMSSLLGCVRLKHPELINIQNISVFHQDALT